MSGTNKCKKKEGGFCSTLCSLTKSKRTKKPTQTPDKPPFGETVSMAIYRDCDAHPVVIIVNTFINSLCSPCCTSPVSDIQSALSSDSSPSESDSTSLLWNTIHSDSPTSNSIYSTLELDFSDYEAKPEITHFPDLTPTLLDQHKKQGIRRPEMVFNPKAVGRHYRGVQRRLWGKFAVEIRDREQKGYLLWLGMYDTDVEAARAYDGAAFKMRGSKEILNIPLEAGKSGPPASTGRKRKREEV
ncbi:hypothetical protein RJ639_033246 [Escallonia herrerae]|uniref:AP2/ERF domain-containing protein n=1 Tax=Escallonia herrerae TaxID=1293975 RepID=A0AA88X0Z2_9ASTE|nr:hypothetical protein RJ639_033246 [Escallonia herrerae]